MKQKFDLRTRTAKAETSFRFGVLANSLFLESWQYETIKLLLEEGHRLEIFIIKKESHEKPSFISKIQNYPYNRLIFRLWNRFIFRPSSKKTKDIAELLSGAKLMDCNPFVKGHTTELPEEMIRNLENENLDFILRFGFNILRGKALNMARFGIWSFHHDDEQEIRGGPPGFWEFYHKVPKNGVILQKLSAGLDKGYLLKKNYYPVIYHSYQAHLDQIYTESALMPAQVCRNLDVEHFTPPLSETRAPIFKPPGNFQMIYFFFLLIYRRIEFHFRFLFRHEDWHIALVGGSWESAMKNPDLFNRIARQSKNSYLADPFFLETSDDKHILAEEFNYSKGKGRIVALKASENYQTPRVVLEENEHLSFPYVLEHEGNHYLIPECYQSRTVKLYRIDTKEVKAHFVGELLTGYAAVDPVVFRHEGRWWLLFTEKSFPSVHLYAFYSDHLLGPYIPHQNNPVKTDIASARNAGMPFREGGKLIRPVQDCSLHYGRAVNLCEILSLSPSHFEEKIVGRLSPSPLWPYKHGLHTYNKCSDGILIDGKRFGFTVSGFLHQAELKFRKGK